MNAYPGIVSTTLLLGLVCIHGVSCYQPLTLFTTMARTDLYEQTAATAATGSSSSRRFFLTQIASTVTVASTILFTNTQPSLAATFTPGGTLVDRPVGVTVNNPEASTTRAFDNSNVLFQQDYFFKFGAAAPWIDESNRLEFPAQMPFVRVQQRYDALQKYGARVQRGLEQLEALLVNPDGVVLEADHPMYALRALGLLANGLCASENTGTTNELLLARYYVNEIYLGINDIRTKNPDRAKQSHQACLKAANSYLNMMNRVIPPKVGEPFVLLTIRNNV